jgi:hypothetical protein
MSPQPTTPFFEIITIPPLYRDMGMVMIGLRGVSRLDKSEKGASSILQNLIWISPRRAAIRNAKNGDLLALIAQCVRWMCKCAAGEDRRG